MKVAKITIKNFRGISQAEIFLPEHGVLVGDNNTGKTSVLEALDLVLGPDRLNRRPPVDEHDFFRGKYLHAPELITGQNDGEQPAAEADPEIQEQDNPMIEIEVTVVGLSEEQLRHFYDYLEFWDEEADELYDKPEPDGVDAGNISPALRIKFNGWYDANEDDFDGRSYFARTFDEGAGPQIFNRKDKQHCGFLYLRSVRTGSRALSLER
ncbi:MAG: ATP-binding protein [Devosiaceae bacterium]|nr:ATP-binding protein [Devosiaceae bacterium]